MRTAPLATSDVRWLRRAILSDDREEERLSEQLVGPLLRLALGAAAGTLVGISGGRFAPAKWPSTMTAAVLGAVAGLLTNVVSGIAPVAPWMRFFVVTRTGVLVGLGMIGAGIVIRTERLAKGLTMAAALFVCGVVGICIGSGQVILGLAAAVLAVICLQVGGWLEQRLSKGSRRD